jgi:hypothetical protein
MLGGGKVTELATSSRSTYNSVSASGASAMLSRGAVQDDGAGPVRCSVFGRNVVL